MTATKIKSAASRVGNAILDASTVIHNVSLQNQIDEIDSQIDALSEQMVRLQEDRSELEQQKI